MEAESILGVYAQLAVFIVALSGIIGVVGHGANEKWIAADYLRFRTMIASGFVLLFQSIFPIILLHFALTASRLIKRAPPSSTRIGTGLVPGAAVLPVTGKA